MVQKLSDQAMLCMISSRCVSVDPDQVIRAMMLAQDASDDLMDDAQIKTNPDDLMDDVLIGTIRMIRRMTPWSRRSG